MRTTIVLDKEEREFLNDMKHEKMINGTTDYVRKCILRHRNNRQRQIEDFGKALSRI